jgi:hypothetical protein
LPNIYEWVLKNFLVSCFWILPNFG